VLTHALAPRIANASPSNIMFASATPAFNPRYLSTKPTPACKPLVDARSESIEKIL
jgi:hypothetical protein